MFINDEDNCMFVQPDPELVGTNLSTIVDYTGYKGDEPSRPLPNRASGSPILGTTAGPASKPANTLGLSVTMD